MVRANVTFSLTAERLRSLLPDQRQLLERIAQTIVLDIRQNARSRFRSAVDLGPLPNLSQSTIRSRERSSRLQRDITDPSATRSNLTETGQLLDSLTFDFETSASGNASLAIFFDGNRTGSTQSNAEVYGHLLDLNPRYSVLGLSERARTDALAILVDEIRELLRAAIRRLNR